MKTIAQFTISLAALAGLLYGATARATNLSELPLKASVYIKPNVIFGYDDSGSMRFETLLDGTENGRLQWNSSTRTAWNADGSFLKATGLPIHKLFPVRTTTDPSDSMSDPYGWGIPPTAQFAQVRSHVYNNIYFNPGETYVPWSPAYVSSLEKTYTKISIANALTGSVRAPVDPRNPTGDYVDLMLTRQWQTQAAPGMVIPVGSSYRGGGVWNGPITAARTMDELADVRVPAYPATYWLPVGSSNKGVTVADCVVDNVACMLTTGATPVKMRRFEIKRDQYASDDAFKTEMQNFANWFSYYRKRNLMVNAAIGKVMEGLTGMRIGMMRFSSNTNVVMYDLDSSNPAKNGKRVAGLFYEVGDTTQGTPTKNNLKNIGEQYKRPLDADSPAKPMIQYACQRNNAFVVTDGFYNGSSPSIPEYNRSKWGASAPQATTATGTLADIALHYYTTNPRGDLPTGKVPSGKVSANQDINNDLHVNTYGLALNLEGDLWKGNDMPLPTATTYWNTPADNLPSALDDLWHATVNGRGQLYLAKSPQDTATRIAEGLRDIASQVGSQGGIAVGSVNLDRPGVDKTAYLANFDPSAWGGDLTANEVDAETGAVSKTPKWRAAKRLAERTTPRLIVADTPSGALPFTNDNVGTIVNPDTVDFPDNAKVVDYLRGSRAGEGTTFRTRTSLMGAVINAEPVVDRINKVVYIESGEGMLHAFDTDNGNELWAYVPRAVLGTAGNSPIGSTVERAYSFKTKLDATPTLATMGATRMLISGMGAAGRGYFALDVTSPKPANESTLASMARWNFTDPRMGYSTGKAVLVNTNAQDNVVLVPSGYDNGDSAVAHDNRGWMWMLDGTTGAPIKRFYTPQAVGGEPGISHLSAYKESNGKVRYVYAGDLNGTIWRFDLQATGFDVVGEVVAQLKDANNNAQPITTAPELYQVGDRRVILVGTGRLLDTSDFGTTSFTNSFYAIADKIGSPLDNARTELVNRSYTRNASNVATSSVNTSTPMNWSTKRGWFIDLPVGEHDNTNPVVALGSVIFATNTNGGASCDQSSYLYLLDVGTGGPVATGSWVSQLLSNSVSASRALTLRVKNGDIVITNHMGDDTVKSNSAMSQGRVQATRNSWREVNR